MKMKIKKIYKLAFTLAEILVTLTILGVVFAALAPTINTFNQERAEKTFRAKTGKSYSMISEALRARFAVDQQRMVGNVAASNLGNYLISGKAGAIRFVNIKDNALKTPDGMVFAFIGDNCHKKACFIVVDMDGQKKGATSKIEQMNTNFDNKVYQNASAEEAADPETGHADIAVFMVKDGQVYPYTDYTAENMQMAKNTNTTLQTQEMNLQLEQLNINPD